MTAHPTWCGGGWYQSKATGASYFIRVLRMKLEMLAQVWYGCSPTGTFDRVETYPAGSALKDVIRKTLSACRDNV